MVRVLALHGYAQSAEIFKKKMSAVRKACGKNVDFVFLDAPIMLKPADMPNSASNVQALDTIQAAPDEPELQPRAWWTVNSDKSVYYHLPETVEYLKNYLKNERFDGILGFSQGSCMAAVITAVLERPESYPPFLIDGEAPHPPFKFSILVSGFRPADSEFGPIFNTPLTTPSLHVLGRNDAIVSLERAYTLVHACANPRVEEHEGGHFVPSKASWRTFFKEYFLSFDPVLGGKSVASPTPALGGDTPGTGTPSEISRVGTPSKM
ncbi:FSH1-domain-containing protein [Ceratobasidium sp. AG-I]|nr:FSH1-domain-containing protein [Ceratobasidium sp. AG-I]